MKLCLTGLATALAAFALPAAASAAELRVDPPKPCYGSGQTVNLLGTGFTPNLPSGISVTKDGEFDRPAVDRPHRLPERQAHPRPAQRQAHEHLHRHRDL